MSATGGGRGLLDRLAAVGLQRGPVHELDTAGLKIVGHLIELDEPCRVVKVAGNLIPMLQDVDGVGACARVLSHRRIGTRYGPFDITQSWSAIPRRDVERINGSYVLKRSEDYDSAEAGNIRCDHK